jgi:ABC-type sulfate transport system permease subunit
VASLLALLALFTLVAKALLERKVRQEVKTTTKPIGVE